MRSQHWTVPAAGLVIGAWIAMAAWVPVHAAGNGADALFDLSLGELLDVEVTTVSKRPQRLSHSAAAVFVIAADDIRRSGATAVPELLRMVPGVQVARIDSSTWAVSARGFNGQFANKLLVLVDGRSVYTPTFSGVYWDVQDLPLDVIDRIEVIRGPGATLWGANAVNGVINIITRPAAATQGTRLSAAIGSEDRAIASARYGAAFGGGHYRVYAKGFERDSSALGAGSGSDDWGQGRVGFRVDSAPAGHPLTVSGDYYRGHAGEDAVMLSATPPHQRSAALDTDVSGGHLLANWVTTTANGGRLTVQGYYDRTRRDWARLSERRDTFDIDVQHEAQIGTRHHMVFGTRYRITHDSTVGSFTTSLSPRARSDQLLSAFVQDEIDLVADRWFLTLGSKFEHNDYSGFEIQPNVRLLWTPAPQHTLWASVARAVRTPSRADHDARVVTTVLAAGSAANPAPVPLTVAVSGTEDVVAEHQVAYELGYRGQFAGNLGVDAAAFYNDYGALRSTASGTTVCTPSGTPPGCLFGGATGLLAPATLGSRSRGEAYGLELAFDWRPATRWRFQGAWSALQIALHQPPGAAGGEVDETSSPHQQFSMRGSHQLGRGWSVDLWLRATGPIVVAQSNGNSVSIPGYSTLDARLGWEPSAGLELSLGGRNLLVARHPEYVTELGGLPAYQVERSVFGQLSWSF